MTFERHIKVKDNIKQLRVGKLSHRGQNSITAWRCPFFYRPIHAYAYAYAFVLAYAMVNLPIRRRDSLDRGIVLGKFDGGLGVLWEELLAVT